MDRQADLLLTLLKDASWYPDGITLYRVGKNPGLLSSKTGPLQSVAQEALQSGYLELVKQEGKADAARLTPRGEAYLREHADPRNALEELLTQLRSTQQGMPRWVAEIEAQFAAFRMRMQTFLDQHGQALVKLIHRAEAALRRLETSPGSQPVLESLEPWQVELLMILDRQGASSGSTPLPRLFSQLHQAGFQEVTIPDFHNGLLLLRDRGSLKLHQPAQGLDSLSEPEYALVDEGLIYYATSRN